MKKITFLLFGLIAGFGLQGCGHSSPPAAEYQTDIPEDDALIGLWAKCSDNEKTGEKPEIAFASNGTMFSYNGFANYWGKTILPEIYFASKNGITGEQDRFMLVFLAPTGELKISRDFYAPEQAVGLAELLKRGDILEIVGDDTAEKTETRPCVRWKFVGKKKAVLPATEVAPAAPAPEAATEVAPAPATEVTPAPAEAAPAAASAPEATPAK